MALTADQQAVLELLLSGQGYSELEQLLGLSDDALRERARGALAELGGADPDRSVGLTDYLLGQADPIGRADAVRHLRQDPPDHELARRVLEELRSLAPDADLPRLPPAPGGAGPHGRDAAGAAAVSTGERHSPFATLSQRRSRLYAVLGAGAVVLIAAVLAAAGAFSGGSDEDSGVAGGDEATASANGAGDGFAQIPDGEELSRVPLTAPGSGDARGAAIVGLATGDQPYLDMLIERLERAPAGEAYVIWFMFDADTGYPLSPIFPTEDGSFNDRFAIPTVVASLIPRARRIEVSISDAEQTLREIQRAARNEEFRIKRPGRAVLSGTIPRAQQAQDG